MAAWPTKNCISCTSPSLRSQAWLLDGGAGSTDTRPPPNPQTGRGLLCSSFWSWLWCLLQLASAELSELRHQRYFESLWNGSFLLVKMVVHMKWSRIVASSAFKEVIWRGPKGFSLPPSTFYINSRSWHLFLRPSVKVSKNVLEKPLSLHVDSTVPLNPGIMKDKVFSSAGSWLHRSLCLRSKSPFSGFSEDRSENSKEKARRCKGKKKKIKRKHEWKELKQWERGSEERNSLKMTIKSVVMKKKNYLSWDTGNKIRLRCIALLSDTLLGEFMSTWKKEQQCSTARDAYIGNVPAYTAPARLALCRLPTRYKSKIKPCAAGFTAVF